MEMYENKALRTQHQTEGRLGDATLEEKLRKSEELIKGNARMKVNENRRKKRGKRHKSPVKMEREREETY